MNIKHIFNEIVQTLYPDDVRCMVCGREIYANRYCLCDDCAIVPNDNYCLRCGRHKVGIGDHCSECGRHSLHFDEARSATDYSDNVTGLIKRFKYGGAPYLAKPMSAFMLDVLLTTDWQFDCFTFVPMHKTRKRKRGYNQAQLLANALSLATDRPCVELLQKTVHTVNQARLNREQRLANLNGTFSCSAKPPHSVVLIDDVMTTGATADECAKTLKKAGAAVVYVLTFASVGEKPPIARGRQNISEFRKQKT